MRNYEINSLSSGSPIFSAFGFLLIALIGFILIGPLIGTFVAGTVYDGDLITLVEKLQNPYDEPGLKLVMFILQGFATGIGLILIPWLYIKFVNRRSLGDLSPLKGYSTAAILISVLVVFSFMTVNSVFIEWNAGMGLPEFMSGVENWMKEREEAAAGLTKFMTTFDSSGELAIAILVVAILPAIGEELVFRGYIQTQLTVGLNNPHLAIWISAALFSAIHLQFFGFIPRMLLGALFGYLYMWSGNLSYPIIAHFVNNAGQLILLYMIQNGTTDIDMDSPESFPITVIILFSFITFGLLYYFRKSFLKEVDTNV